MLAAEKRTQNADIESNNSGIKPSIKTQCCHFAKPEDLVGLSFFLYRMSASHSVVDTAIAIAIAGWETNQSLHCAV
jgi:hypothetical protein